MTIFLKNKHTLQVDNFFFKISIGKNGKTFKKKEGDKKTPKGLFEIEHLYYRKDKIKKPDTKLKCIEIKNNMRWGNDIHYPKFYNRLYKNSSKGRHEKIRRHDYKYNLLIPIKYNFNKPILGLGSCIFIHLTRNYQTTAGCIALKKKDFLILIKLINKRTCIKIY